MFINNLCYIHIISFNLIILYTILTYCQHVKNPKPDDEAVRIVGHHVSATINNSPENLTAKGTSKIHPEIFGKSSEPNLQDIQFHVFFFREYDFPSPYYKSVGEVNLYHPKDRILILFWVPSFVQGVFFAAFQGVFSQPNIWGIWAVPGHAPRKKVLRVLNKNHRKFNTWHMVFNRKCKENRKQ